MLVSTRKCKNKGPEVGLGSVFCIGLEAEREASPEGTLCSTEILETILLV